MHKSFLIAAGCATLSLPFFVRAGDSVPPRLQPVPIQQVHIDDPFWSPKIKVWREVTIPDCLNKFEKDGTLTNFDEIRDGSGGEHHAAPWFDGLLYEMIRASADFLAAQPDPKLEARLDGYIDRIAAAAARDTNGYINTYTQLKEPNHRWGVNGGNDRWQHDLYNAGALVDAGIHYYRATGKTKLLQVGVKMANYMTEVMGPPPKQNIIPGHALAEESFTELWRLFQEQPQLKSQMAVPVDEQNYLALANFWIAARGNHEGRASYGAYDQDEIPVLQQQTIEGHAVRAVLMCSGMVDAAEASHNPTYLPVATRLWDNMVARRMYITGGVGAVADDEKFGLDFQLPNTGYVETCAAVGVGFFGEQMNLAFSDARYADGLERVLYNGALSGVSLQGDSYFYENPLEGDKKRARWSWHGCPCCPPMFLKMMGALPTYIYAQGSNSIYANLFIGSHANLMVDNNPVAIEQTTEYPWHGTVKFVVKPDHDAEFTIYFRAPGWCAEPSLCLNDTCLDTPPPTNGYLSLHRLWKRGDTVELTLPMPIERIHANPNVEADKGRVALQRGPIVYCLEGVDNNDSIHDLALPLDAHLSEKFEPSLLGGITVILGSGLRATPQDWANKLYDSENHPASPVVNFVAIPYFANANRAQTDMEVWIAESPDRTSL